MPAALQPCPICARPQPFEARYPRRVCAACTYRACDEAGRPIEFFNLGLSGGFAARYRDDGEARRGNLCFIDGVECRADEAHLGGVVIQVT